MEPLPATGGLSVIELGPGQRADWEQFVASHPEGLLYHHPAWLEVLSRGGARATVPLGCVNSAGALVGVLPLCRTPGLPGGLGGPRAGRRLSSLPQTPVGGPLALGRGAARVLLSAALAGAREEPGLGLELKPPPGQAVELEGIQTLPWMSSYVLELPSDPGEIRFGASRAHGAVKRAVAKSRKQGVEIRSARSEDELRRWYRLYLGTMRTHLAIPRPYSFFEAMWQLLWPLGHMKLLLAEHGRGATSTMLAGSVFLSFGQTMVFAFNGRRTDALSLRPNDALHWHAIHQAAADGYRFYDLGEVEDGNQGLAHFKEKWGGVPTRLNRQYCPPTEAPGSVSGEPGRARRSAEALWRRMPLRVTELAGNAAYRYL